LIPYCNKSKQTNNYTTFATNSVLNPNLNSIDVVVVAFIVVVVVVVVVNVVVQV